MILLSWNTAGRSKRTGEQVAFLARRQLDLVALQEVTPTSLRALQPCLREAGFVYQQHSLTAASASDKRRSGVLVASRMPLARLTPASVPWPETVLSVQAKINDSVIELHCAHVPPGSSNGWIKVETLEGIYDRLARVSSAPRVLCGDFNTPQAETFTGDVITWAQKFNDAGAVVTRRRILGGDAARWDAAERSVLLRLADFDLRDTFRQLNGYSREDFSWYLTRKGKIVGRRYDHVFASLELDAVRCDYLHEAREKRLSDHSPLEITLGAI